MATGVSENLKSTDLKSTDLKSADLKWKCRHCAVESEKDQTNDKEGVSEKQNLAQQLAVAPLPSSLPPSAKLDNQKMITLGLLTQNNIEVVKRINRVSLPLNYGDRFYSMVIDNRELCRLGKEQV